MPTGRTHAYGHPSAFTTFGNVEGGRCTHGKWEWCVPSKFGHHYMACMPKQQHRGAGHAVRACAWYDGMRRDASFSTPCESLDLMEFGGSCAQRSGVGHACMHKVALPCKLTNHRVQIELCGNTCCTMSRHHDCMHYMVIQCTRRKLEGLALIVKP
jgi:hypothetical protein